MTSKQILFILLTITQTTFLYSQLDSGRYEGKPMNLYLRANNYFKITGQYGDHTISYDGKYSFKGDTLILTEKRNPTRISYFLLRSDSITYLKHYVMADGKVIDHYYKNYVFKDSLETKEIGLANYSFGKTTMPWGFSFIPDSTLKSSSFFKIVSYSIKGDKKLKDETIKKIVAATKIDTRKHAIGTKDYFSRIFQSVYIIDNFKLGSITLTKFDDNDNIIAVIYYKRIK